MKAVSLLRMNAAKEGFKIGSTNELRKKFKNWNPQVAIYQIKNASDDIKDEIKKSGVDIKKDLNISELIKETEEEIKQPMDQMLTDIKHTVNYEPPTKKRVNVESGDNEKIDNEGD